MPNLLAEKTAKRNARGGCAKNFSSAFLLYLYIVSRTAEKLQFWPASCRRQVISGFWKWWERTIWRMELNNLCCSPLVSFSLCCGGSYSSNSNSLSTSSSGSHSSSKSTKLNCYWQNNLAWANNFCLLKFSS